MLSAVFHFSLPELSSSSVIRDLLQSFRLERHSLSVRAPPWDLSLVLRFLRSPPLSLYLRFPSVSLQEDPVSPLPCYGAAGG